MRKKETIGLVPQMDEVCRTIAEYLTFLKYPQVLDNIQVFTAQKFRSVADSTIRQNMGTLINYGLVIEVEDYVYQTSGVGKKWLETKDPIGFFWILDEHIAFIGEILFELGKGAKDRESLQRTAFESYGYEFHNSDLTRRLQILRSIDLIEMDRHKRYHITETGQEVLKSIKVEPQIRPNKNITVQSGIVNKVQDVLQEQPKVRCNNMEEETKILNGSYNDIFADLTIILRRCDGCKGGFCKTFVSRVVPIYINGQEHHRYADFAVVGRKEAIQENLCVDAPDVVVCIESSTGHEKKYFRKIRQYKDDGVKECWILDLVYQDIFVFDLFSNDVCRFRFSDKVNSRVINNLQVDFGELLAKC